MANRLFDKEQRSGLFSMLTTKKAEVAAFAAQPVIAAPAATSSTAFKIDAVEPPRPPDTQLHVKQDIALEEVWPLINPMMLYARHLGLKGKIHELIAAGDKRAIELRETVKRIEDEILEKNLLVAKTAWQFVRAARLDGSILP